MTSLRKLTDYGLEKVIPDDELLTEAYQAFHHSNELRDVFKKARGKYEDEENAIDIPKNLRCQVRAVLQKNRDLRWDEALQVVVDETQLDRVRTEKKKARTKAGDFTDNDDEEGEDWGDDDDGD
jgi:hypothetical protein